MPLRLEIIATQVFWIGTSFLLASTVFQHTSASLSYTSGPRPILLLPVVLLPIRAILAALANNVTEPLAGRVTRHRRWRHHQLVRDVKDRPGFLLGGL